MEKVNLKARISKFILIIYLEFSKHANNIFFIKKKNVI